MRAEVLAHLALTLLAVSLPPYALFVHWAGRGRRMAAAVLYLPLFGLASLLGELLLRAFMPRLLDGTLSLAMLFPTVFAHVLLCSIACLASRTLAEAASLRL